MKTESIKTRDGKFQINCKGAWRGEYKTDCMISSGTTCPVIDTDGNTVGTWMQVDLGHHLGLIGG